ncbi:TPR repeat protein [Calothrix parasitica NIES-267]|uniref:TPR repeat protein n=1 Tax=Calothrix parasitica NIES-267 TaxID=1973488 RepID=A0A1Z4LSW3_9CYAN|nr:TPR repeat protein [Calothrix parasitica NIES-267]
MKFYRYTIVALLAFLLTTNLTPVAAKSPISINPSSITQIKQSNILFEGKQFYDEGKLTQAAQIWEKAVKEFEQQGELRNQVLANNYLSVVYQDLGKWEAATKAVNNALKLVKQVDDGLLSAQVLNTNGNLKLKTGNPQTALDNWKQSEKIYRQLGDVTGIVLSQINQAQALQNLGFYRRGRTKLEQVAVDLEKLPDSLLKARGLRSLGITLQAVGDLDNSQKVLLQSLNIAQKSNYAADIAQVLLVLGNSAKVSNELTTALDYYQKAAAIAPDYRSKLSAQINQFSLLVKIEQPSSALELLPEIKNLFTNIPSSRFSVYSRVNLAQSIINNKELGVEYQELGNILATAVKQARELKDIRAEAYAVGQLGHLYEQTKQFSEALKLTRNGLTLAQGIQAPDISATLLWQQGRIYKARGNQESAISAYSQAVNNLKSLRQDLVQMNPNVQFTFRDEVEPVYRELVQLLLQDVDNLTPQIKQQRLEKSRQIIEGLQVAELENFLRAACLTYQPQPIEQIDKNAAVIYPIIIDNRLEVVLSLPNRPLQHYSNQVSPEEEIAVFNQLRQSLNVAFPANEVLPPAQKVYDWLIRPIEAELEKSQTKTLVFVLDGFLRSLPMSVLHDGEKFIIEKYNIALTPSLQLFESRNIPSQQFKALTGGLAKARQGFSALPGVETEITRIANFLKTQTLLNEQFTRPQVQNKIETAPFSVIHLATHGQFSSKAEDTFLLTWKDRINVKDLGKWLKTPSSNLRNREPIELLVLSACQTAKGDKRAALGLAGVAVRSGARSTLATLWSVQDKSTADLVTEFYRVLTQDGINKAQALRQAQLSLLKDTKYQHPYYWSPFVLVGNWQ